MNYIYIIGSFLLGIIIAHVITKHVERLKFEAQHAHMKSKLDSLLLEHDNKEEFKNMLKEEFINMANSALISKQQILEEQNLKNLDLKLNPLKEKLSEFEKKVENFNKTGEINTSIIKDQIESITKENNSIRMQAENLANAIKDNAKSRGIFGEMILENILKSSGLENKNDNAQSGMYLTQTGFVDKNNPDSAKVVPDAVIYYPEDDKNIIVDSKLSLIDFLNYIESNDESEKELALKGFYKAIELRIDELANKYTNLEGLSTPDFTLMFIPIENCINYIYANQKVVEYAYKKRVVIVGPSSLIATLRVVKYAWAQKNQEKNVKEVVKLGESIYSKVVVLISNLEKLNVNFSSVQKTFAGIFTNLQGRGGLFSQTQKLKEYGVSSSNNIDNKYIEDNMLLEEQEAVSSEN